MPSSSFRQIPRLATTSKLLACLARLYVIPVAMSVVFLFFIGLFFFSGGIRLPAARCTISDVLVSRVVCAKKGQPVPFDFLTLVLVLTVG